MPKFADNPDHRISRRRAKKLTTDSRVFGFDAKQDCNYLRVNNAKIGWFTFQIFISFWHFSKTFSMGDGVSVRSVYVWAREEVKKTERGSWNI